MEELDGRTNSYPFVKVLFLALISFKHARSADNGPLPLIGDFKDDGNLA